MSFESRSAAGRALAAALRPYVHDDAIVLGVTRGGLAVAAEVAHALRRPLDVLIVHTIVAPGPAHVPVGVVAEPDHVVLARSDDAALADPAWLESAVAQGVAQVRRRGGIYRGMQTRPALAGRQVIVVDDSAATGLTMQAAVHAARAGGVRAIALPCRSPRRT